MYVFYIKNVWHGQLSVHLLCNMNDAGGRVELIAARTQLQGCSGGVVDRAKSASCLE